MDYIKLAEEVLSPSPPGTPTEDTVEQRVDLSIAFSLLSIAQSLDKMVQHQVDRAQR